MDDDVDFDDLLGEERVVESMTTKRPDVDLSKAPSDNELRLGRRVMELENERDSLKSQLDQLRSSQPTSPSTSGTSGPLTIPHSLLPTLDVLRRHIAELSRDNAALRYTFLGQPSLSTAGPSGIARSGSPVIPSLDQVSITDAKTEKIQGVDLEKVVQRVKAVMLENEELGAMVLEAGGRGVMLEEWQKALDESTAVISSLDSDLTHHLSTIQSLRAELHAAKSTPSSSSRTSHGKTPSIALNPASSAFAPPRGPASRPRARESESIKSESVYSPTLSQGSALPPGSSSDRRGGKHRDSERDRDRDRERDKEAERLPPKGPRDDRDSKRRR